MTRDRLIVFGIIGAAVVLALSRGVVTSTTLLLLCAAIPSIILHEVSHGVVALAFGDDTAKQAGRITLNPIRHVDPFGTVILPALLALSSLGVFGYAKPVPINPSRMRHPRNDAVWVSLAGPATNVLLALVAGLWLRLLHPFANYPFGLELGSGPWLWRILLAFGFVNVVLAVLNLIPIPPLDGSAVITRFVPKAWAHGWDWLRQYGIFLLAAILLLGRGALAHLYDPALRLWEKLLA